MVWQAETTSGAKNRATDHHDFMTKATALATSQHVATVTVNSGGGSTYVLGDILTLTHASSVLDARFEVTDVSGGVIQAGGLRIVSSGAFSLRVATVAIGASGGSGYIDNEIVEIQGGSSRSKAKGRVTGQTAGVVDTVVLFELGGAYSSAPAVSDATTVSVGPTPGVGTGLLVDTTTTALITPLTNIAVTGGGGTGATVDITLAQSGWTAERDSNDYTFNETNEKIVVLKGDASGVTNKPYIMMISFDSNPGGAGTDRIMGVAFFGITAHNSAVDAWLQPGISPGIDSGTGFLVGGGSFLLFPIDTNDTGTPDQETNFWITIDDRRIAGVTNTNPAAGTTDDGEYMRFHAGLMNAYGTEIENPYPMMVGASSRNAAISPKIASQHISGLPECTAPTASLSPWHYYEAENSIWRTPTNSVNLTAGTRVYIVYPFGHLSEINDANSAERIVADGAVDTFGDWTVQTRIAAPRRLLRIPGTTPEHFLWPINIISRAGSGSTNNVEDSPRGEVRDWFFTTSTNATGGDIANFSEDFVTVGTDRYRVFQNHVHTQSYQYVAIKEDV